MKNKTELDLLTSSLIELKKELEVAKGIQEIDLKTCLKYFDALDKRIDELNKNIDLLAKHLHEHILASSKNYTQTYSGNEIKTYTYSGNESKV